MDEISPQPTLGDPIELLYKQIWAFAEYFNDSNGKVETWKYFDFLLFCIHQKFVETGYKSRWEYPEETND